jgi:hypothetical protein
MFDALVSCLSNLINEQCTFLLETPWIGALIMFRRPDAPSEMISY